MTAAGLEKGVAKAKLSWDKALVAGFLTGAYIVFGALFATVTTAGMRVELWGTLPTFFAGTVFSLGVILVVIGGAELLTGDMALLPLAAFRGRITVRDLFPNLGFVLIGNLLGAMFVAYFRDGIASSELPLERLEQIALANGVEETKWQIFLRATGCNWLVCLAVMLAPAAQDVGGPSSRWASTTWSRTCSSSRRGSSPTSTSRGGTRSTTGSSPSSGTSPARRSSSPARTGTCTPALRPASPRPGASPSPQRPEAEPATPTQAPA